MDSLRTDDPFPVRFQGAYWRDLQAEPPLERRPLSVSVSLRVPDVRQTFHGLPLEPIRASWRPTYLVWPRGAYPRATQSPRAAPCREL